VFIILLSFCFLLLSACSKDNPEITPTEETSYKISHSSTGWELYSRQTESKWNYSILIGTSRLKTYEDVVNSISVIGEENLKKVLSRFPEGENIMWIGEGWLKRCWQSGYKDLTLPPNEIIEEIKQYCNEQKLILYVTD